MKNGLKSQCKSCKSEYHKRWREANPDKARECHKRWNEANLDKVREYNKRRYEANLEKVRERSKRWQKANPEKAREKNKRWREHTPISYVKGILKGNGYPPELYNDPMFIDLKRAHIKLIRATRNRI